MGHNPPGGEGLTHPSHSLHDIHRRGCLRTEIQKSWRLDITWPIDQPLKFFPLSLLVRTNS